MSTQTASPEVNAPGVNSVRLHRTVRVIAEALERRRRKIAAGLPVEPPPHCPCVACRFDDTEGAPDAA